MGTVRVDKTLVEALAAAGAGKVRTFAEIEDLVEELKAALGQQCTDVMLAELGPEDGKSKPCPSCKKLVAVRIRNRERTIESLSGTHKLVRNYYRCDACALGFYPRDAELGLADEGVASLKLEQRVLDFAVNETFEECAERWRVHYPHRPFPRTSSGASRTA